jgi:hypothetical protein
MGFIARFSRLSPLPLPGPQYGLRHLCALDQERAIHVKFRTAVVRVTSLPGDVSPAVILQSPSCGIECKIGDRERTDAQLNEVLTKRSSGARRRLA